MAPLPAEEVQCLIAQKPLWATTERSAGRHRRRQPGGQWTAGEEATAWPGAAGTAAFEGAPSEHEQMQQQMQPPPLSPQHQPQQQPQQQQKQRRHRRLGVIHGHRELA